MKTQETIDTITVISKLWPIFASLVVGAGTALIWFIRLENKVNNNQKEIQNNKEDADKKISEHKADVERNHTAIWQDIKNINTNFNQLFQSLGEIKGLINKKGD